MNVPSFISEIISLLASLALLFQKGIPNYLKWFVPMLFLTVLVEIAGWQLGNRRISNVMLYNVFTTLEFEFYLYILGNIIYNAVFRKVILAIMWIFPVLVILNILFVQVEGFHTFTYSIGSVAIVSICIFYFLELFRLPKSVKLIREPSFWICSGLLFFYCCSFPLFGLINYMDLNTIPLVVLQNIGVVLMFLNIIHYTLFTIAFLCGIRIRPMERTVAK